MAEVSLTDALESAVASEYGGDEWVVSTDGAASTTVDLPDRRLVVRHRDGPDGGDRWTVELAADGATVSKFGPFESVAASVAQVETLLEGDVQYTVCCDG
jgi:hypothetical protein